MKKLGQALWNGFEWLVRTVMGFLLRLVHIEWDEEQWQKFMQFVIFCLVGVANAVVNFVTYTVVLFLFELCGWDGVLFGIRDCHIHLSTFFGLIAMIFNSYFWNRRVTFRDQGSESTKEGAVFLKVAVTYGVVLLLQLLLTRLLWRGLFSLPELLVNPLNQICTLPVSFLLNKFWAYR